jgi:hypothetical protein
MSEDGTEGAGLARALGTTTSPPDDPRRRHPRRDTPATTYRTRCHARMARGLADALPYVLVSSQKPVATRRRGQNCGNARGSLDRSKIRQVLRANWSAGVNGQRILTSWRWALFTGVDMLALHVPRVRPRRQRCLRRGRSATEGTKMTAHVVRPGRSKPLGHAARVLCTASALGGLHVAVTRE